jgi:hypothetical protein
VGRERLKDWELHSMHSLPNIIERIKANWMKRTRQAEYVGEMRNEYTIFV